MTAKEKANEIVNKFYHLRAYEVMSDTDKKIAYGIAKESALICVEEIIKALEQMEFNYGVDDTGEIPYWNRIKQELNKL